MEINRYVYECWFLPFYGTVKCEQYPACDHSTRWYISTSMGVVWHTGKVLACGAVGPRFKPRQGQGIL